MDQNCILCWRIKHSPIWTFFKVLLSNQSSIIEFIRMTDTISFDSSSHQLHSQICWVVQRLINRQDRILLWSHSIIHSLTFPLIVQLCFGFYWMITADGVGVAGGIGEEFIWLFCSLSLWLVCKVASLLFTFLTLKYQPADDFWEFAIRRQIGKDCCCCDSSSSIHQSINQDQQCDFGEVHCISGSVMRGRLAALSTDDRWPTATKPADIHRLINPNTIKPTNYWLIGSLVHQKSSNSSITSSSTRVMTVVRQPTTTTQREWFVALLLWW